MNELCRVALLKKRVKIEIADGTNEKVTITLEGNMSKERIMHLMDILHLLETPASGDQNSEPEERSKFDKVQILLERKFPAGWFTSQDVMVAYEDLYDEPIGLSTVSTYLARLVGRGTVNRSGSLATRRYRLRRSEDANKRRVLLPQEKDEGGRLRGGVL